MKIASDFGVDVECIVFDYSVAECIQRCKRRKNHETIKPGEADRIVKLVKRQLKYPAHRTTVSGSQDRQSNKMSTEFCSIVTVDSVEKANAQIKYYLSPAEDKSSDDSGDLVSDFDSMNLN